MSRGGARPRTGVPGNLNGLQHGRSGARLRALTDLVPPQTAPYVVAAVKSVIEERDYGGGSGKRPSYGRAITRVRDAMIDAMWSRTARSREDRHRVVVEVLEPLISERHRPKQPAGTAA